MFESSNPWKNPTTESMCDALVSQIIKDNSDITNVRDADAAKKAAYAETLAQFETQRGGALWYPYIGSGRGNGALVELRDGSIKYDLISGIGVHWGHSHPKLLKATLEATLHSTVMHGNLQQDMLTVDLVSLLIQHSGLPHAFISTSGAMANENALKLAFYHHPGRTRVLAFERCFMGRTLALASITDKAAYREGLPITLAVDYLPFYDSSSPEKSAKKLRDYVRRYPGQHAALCVELIQGEGGYYPAPASFFKELIDIAKAADISILADEVQTFGRTECLFVSQSLGLIDDIDILTVGKLLQVCATLFRSTHKPKPGLISQTFTGSSTALAAGISILTQLTTEPYLGTTGKIMTLSQLFRDRLSALASRYPGSIHGPFGYGSMIAFTPFKGSMDDAKNLCTRLFEEGIIGFVAGAEPTRVRFLLPMGGIQESDLAPIFQHIERAIASMRMVAIADGAQPSYFLNFPAGVGGGDRQRLAKDKKESRS
jgi:acetylornithine/N-succinyldiaminopimelate aminotransferase